jgi:PIN domain nuclease of toxin-antitoxin system
MDLILDTHALIWFFSAHPDLAEAQRKVLGDDKNRIFISSVSAFEIATKYRIEKLPEAKFLYENFKSVLSDFNYLPLAVTPDHGLLAGALKGDHRDPFDRLLAAQSIIEGIPVMTVDAAIKDLGAEVLW